MTKCFVDTTVLTDLLLKKDGSEARAEACLSRYSVQIFPEYAWKEFKRGPLSAFRWAYEKLSDTRSFAKALLMLQSISRGPKRNFISTAIQALHTAQNDFAKFDLQSLSAKYGKRANIDSVQADWYRLELKKAILGSWQKQRQLGCDDQLACYSNEPPVHNSKGEIKLDPLDCRTEDCCLRSRLSNRQGDLHLLAAGLLKCDQNKKEIISRTAVVNQLVNRPEKAISRKQCAQFGDAYFALFCPSGADILSTNLVDMQPIGSALGKNCVKP